VSNGQGVKESIGILRMSSIKDADALIKLRTIDYKGRRLIISNYESIEIVKEKILKEKKIENWEFETYIRNTSGQNKLRQSSNSEELNIDMNPLIQNIQITPIIDKEINLLRNQLVPFEEPARGFQFHKDDYIDLKSTKKALLEATCNLMLAEIQANHIQKNIRQSAQKERFYRADQLLVVLSRCNYLKKIN